MKEAGGEERRRKTDTQFKRTCEVEKERGANGKESPLAGVHGSVKCCMNQGALPEDEIESMAAMPRRSWTG